jgi:hypothetical protein
MPVDSGHVRSVRVLFALVAAYDGVLGVLGFLVPGWLFAGLGVSPPQVWGYVQFASALLMVFAAMFVAIARDPVGHRGLIPYGVGVKVAYCATVVNAWMTGTLARAWIPFAVVDAFVAVVFILVYVRLRPRRTPRAPRAGEVSGTRPVPPKGGRHSDS